MRKICSYLSEKKGKKQQHAIVKSDDKRTVLITSYSDFISHLDPVLPASQSAPADRLF